MGDFLLDKSTQIEEIQESVNFIDTKQQFYDDVLAGRQEYWSNLIDAGNTQQGNHTTVTFVT